MYITIKKIGIFDNPALLIPGGCRILNFKLCVCVACRYNEHMLVILKKTDRLQNSENFARGLVGFSANYIISRL